MNYLLLQAGSRLLLQGSGALLLQSQTAGGVGNLLLGVVTLRPRLRGLPLLRPRLDGEAVLRPLLGGTVRVLTSGAG